jgi:hypothetical protein
MSNLIACQPGWVAVFKQLDGDGYTTEPIACWLLVEAPHQDGEVRPICALGGDVCDATLAKSYVGVVGPCHSSGNTADYAKQLVAAFNESRANKPAA